MFAVIFEVTPYKDRWDDYLGLAKMLRPELEAIDGFIDNERFASQRTEGRVLSLSTWRDEKAVIRWRTLAAHHAVQEKGRFEVFRDYHLRVGEFTADSDMPSGQSLLQQRLDETEVGDAKCVTISEYSSANGRPAASDCGVPVIGQHGLLDIEVYDSIVNPGKLLVLGSRVRSVIAEAGVPKAPPQCMFRHREVRVIRDYGMRDRREAPQYYPEVDRRTP